MKKTFLMLMALVALVAPTVTAQKVDEKGLLQKMQKSDAEIADAKKAQKATAWTNRTKVYADALMAPTKDIDLNLDQLILFQWGEPEDKQMDANGRQILIYPWVNVYVANGRIAAWVETKSLVKEDALTTILEASKKAIELDPKQTDKIRPILAQVLDFYIRLGEVGGLIPDYAAARDAFFRVLDIHNHPLFDKPDPKYYYIIGQISTYLGSSASSEDAKIAYFADGEKYLNLARESGYKDETGQLNYYLFHCYYGQKSKDAGYVMKAKEILLEGVEKYPKNERILEGLMSLYTMEEGVGNPEELVALIDRALAENPTNPDLWFGRGQVFYKLKNFDECIVSFKKIDELRPNDYDTNYYIGIFYASKGDKLNRELNARSESIDSQEEYMAEQKKVLAVYMGAVPYLEKAHELQPSNVDCAQILKELCFRLRNEEGMMPKYEKYNAIYKKLKGLE